MMTESYEHNNKTDQTNEMIICALRMSNWLKSRYESPATSTMKISQTADGGGGINVQPNTKLQQRWSYDGSGMWFIFVSLFFF